MALSEHYTIPLPPVTKKNSSQIIFTGQKCPVCKRGRLARLLPSKKYREYEEAALWCLQRKEPITTPVNVKCLFYMPTARKVDLTNLLEAADDALVTAGVLADDNSKIVVSHDGSRVLLAGKNRELKSISRRHKMSCDTCRWWEPYNAVCCHGDSPYCADFVTYGCEEWEAMQNAQEPEI